MEDFSDCWFSWFEWLEHKLWSVDLESIIELFGKKEMTRY